MAENKVIYIKNMVLMKRKYKAPGKNGNVTVPSRNGRGYSFSYATLDDLINAVHKAVADAEVFLDFSQDIKNENGMVWVQTKIEATDGKDDWWTEKFSWFGLPANAQVKDIGGAATYARRYSLASALGLATEEDNDIRDLEEVPQQSHNNGDNRNQPQLDRNAQIKMFDDAVITLKQSFGQTDESIYQVIPADFNVHNHDELIKLPDSQLVGLVKWMQQSVSAAQRGA